MNNPRNLEFYSQILVFKNGSAKENILFAQSSSLEQRTLQSIAHSLSLEYEYSVATRNVTISRPVRQATGPVTGFNALLLRRHTDRTVPRPIYGRSPPDLYLSESQDVDTQLSETPSSVHSAEIMAAQSENFDWMNGFENQMSFDTPNFSRSGSIHSGASEYKEYVFDANSMHSSSQASVTSAASGRRGPLSDWARAGMNSVRKVGACWRCKILRKTVSCNI
jgi:hypothetical protein